MIEQIVFYFFAGVLLLSASMVVIMRNPIHAALFLVLSFFSSAAIWLLLQAEFLAIVLVLVYVGAVMVLFLFVVMMLDINLARLREGFWHYLPVGAFVAIVLVAEMVLVLAGKYGGFAGVPAPPPLPPAYSNTKELGRLVYTEYVYAFEIAAAILLVAIVAAIAITLRRRKESKYQNPARQVSVRREDRMRIVKMRAEKKEQR